MATLPLNLDECTVKITQKAHYEYPTRMSSLDVVARHPQLGELAKMHCTIVGRRSLFKTHGEILRMMDEESDELMQFSKKLFDAHSNVQPWLIDGGYKSGSGCWGKELNEGQIIHFENLIVEEQFHNRGIGSLILQQLFESPFKQKANIFCWPWPLPPRQINESNTDWRMKVDRINRFFRKTGFRRIGRTSFFGYSTDPNHPSHQLAMQDDPGLLGDEFPDISSLTLEQATLRYPLHVAIDDKLQTSKVADIITTAYAVDPARIHQPYIVGYTPLHVAALRQNLPALRTLLDLGVADDLRNTSNKEHLTPLEILQDKMHRTRQAAEENVFGKWDGYMKEMLVCEYLLKKALGMPLMATSEEEYFVKGRLGCTCGSCEDQWFSPKMSARLFDMSEAASEVMPMEFNKFTSSRPLSADQAKLINTQFLPPQLRVKMYKSFYKGYCAIFNAISCVLQDEADGIPTPARVLSQARSEGYDIEYYIQNGGRVEYALEAIITQAEGQGTSGNDTFDYEDEDDCEGSVCANDMAFQLVRSKLGLEPIMYAGCHDG